MPWADEERQVTLLREKSGLASGAVEPPPRRQEGGVVRDMEAFTKMRSTSGDAGLRAAVGAPPKGEKRPKGKEGKKRRG